MRDKVARAHHNKEKLEDGTGGVVEIRANRGRRSDVAEAIAVALLDGPAVWREKAPRGYRCPNGLEVKHAVKMALAERRLIRVGRGADPKNPEARCVVLTDYGREIAEAIRERDSGREG